MIDCNISNGKTGDARVDLVIDEADGLCLRTNGGLFPVHITECNGHGCSIELAYRELNCTQADIEAATIAAYPAAAAWDW